MASGLLLFVRRILGLHRTPHRAKASGLLLFVRRILGLAWSEQPVAVDVVHLPQLGLLLQVLLPLLRIVMHDLQEQFFPKSLDVDLASLELEVRSIEWRPYGLVLRAIELRKVRALQGLCHRRALIWVKLEGLM